MKKILYYNSTLLKGGTDVYMLNVIKNIDKSNFHVDVIIKDGEDNVQTWDNSFASLTVKIPHDKAFAIRMPNQYGRNSSGNGIPAQVYNRRNDTKYDHKENITFTFTPNIGYHVKRY